MLSSNGETKTNGPFSFYKYWSKYFASGGACYHHHIDIYIALATLAVAIHDSLHPM